MHHLRIADHQIRRSTQGGKGLRQLLFRHHKAQAAAVQAVPDGLHLRQDEAALRRPGIQRHHQQQRAVLRQQVMHQRRLLQGPGRSQTGQRRPDALQSPAFPGRGPQHGDRRGKAVRAPCRITSIRRSAAVDHHGKGDARSGQTGGGIGVHSLPAGGVQHQQSHVHPAHGPQAALHPLGTQRGLLIVQSGRIQKDHRPQGRHLQRLFHRVRRAARRGGNDGHVLPHERVEQGRLARIAPPEQADMQAQGLGTFVHAELLHAGRRSCRTALHNCMLKILMRKIRDGRQDDAFSRAPDLPFQI